MNFDYRKYEKLNHCKRRQKSLKQKHNYKRIEQVPVWKSRLGSWRWPRMMFPLHSLQWFVSARQTCCRKMAIRNTKFVERCPWSHRMPSCWTLWNKFKYSSNSKNHCKSVCFIFVFLFLTLTASFLLPHPERWAFCLAGREEHSSRPIQPEVRETWKPLEDCLCSLISLPHALAPCTPEWRHQCHCFCQQATCRRRVVCDWTLRRIPQQTEEED